MKHIKNEEEKPDNNKKRDHPAIKTDENREHFARIKCEKIIKDKKKIHAKTIVILDDLSNLLKNKIIDNVLSKNRHFLASFYITIHDICQINAGALRQITDVILFPNLSSERVQRVADKCGFIFKCDTNKRYYLEDLYEDATREPYNFLICNRPDMTFRHNFDKEYVIDHSITKIVKDNRKDKNETKDLPPLNKD